ncbi:hypothetical protein As57867_015053, partial [Aphanomyces stellatus]
LHWFDQRLDHFTTLNTTYKQRYFVYDKFWARQANGHKKDGPIFFYCGNEGDVTLYVNNTGLMWENAEAFGALVIFAEHRYFGESMPFGDKYMDHLQYLTHEQALADYAFLLRSFQQDHNVQVPVIAFGGSYGGMLATWFRIKYPTAVQGVIAASAPLFDNTISYPEVFQGPNYWQIVTHDASPKAGSSSNCIANVRHTWSVLFAKANSTDGLAELSSLFQTCAPLQSPADVDSLALSFLLAWDAMAMGNYPYPSSYMTDGQGSLPAFPMRVACDHLAPNFQGDDVALLRAFKAATDIYTNVSGRSVCTPLHPADDLFDVIWCSQFLGQQLYFDSNGVTDMFWPRTLTRETYVAHCQTTWGLTPYPEWIRATYGSPDALLATTSNIVFSNGGFDPWSAAGVRSTSNPTITIVDIPEGAHHLDLMFSDTRDPISVRVARQVEVDAIRQWVQESG